MNHPMNRSSRRSRKASVVVAGLLAASLVACGGDDDEAPVPVTNNSLSVQQISDAQGAVDTAIVAVSAASAPLTAVQIDSQRAALDGSTTDGTANIAANQAALDAAAGLTPGL